MKIIAPHTAITTFSPIGHLKEHDLSMPSKSPNLPMYDDGLKRKREKIDCAAPEKNNVNWSACANQKRSVNKSANVTFGGFFNANRLANSNIFKRGLEFAADNGALFAAGIALATTTLLRPWAIFATPGVKKENKEYACAKSIASGAIGFGVMAAISTPIAQAIKKIDANPEKYLNAETIKNLSSGTNLVKSKKYGLATQLFKLGADFISAIPKALLTCALIPPIMMALFPKRKPSDNIVYFKAGNIDKRSSQIFKGFIKKEK
ncbi:MAG: hypothetical protein K6A44_08180 [bacterium]|nr:hypothetical protein [bacterium]